VGCLVLVLVATGVFHARQPARLTPAETAVIPAPRALVPFGDPSWHNKRLPDGTAAPDFTLPDMRTGAQVTFSQYRGSRPAVLVFGSAGCDNFCDGAGAVRRLYEQFKGKVAFVFVHVTTAPHSLPSQLLQAYRIKHVDSPIRWVNGESGGRMIADYFDFPFPCVLDSRDKTVENLYDAFPRRLVVVQADGRIVRDFGRGLKEQWAFDAIQDCLVQQLKKSPHQVSLRRTMAHRPSLCLRARDRYNEPDVSPSSLYRFSGR
jgi:hypothetical protein